MATLNARKTGAPFAIHAAPGEAGPRLPFEQDAELVLGNLQRAVRALLAGAPGETRRFVDVKRTLGVDPRLAWQIHKIAHAVAPLGAGIHVPARVSMQKLLKAAARRGVSAPVVQSVSEAFDGFERLLEEHAEDREELEAMLSALVPDVREKQEMAVRRSAFKVMSQIKGMASEAELAAFFLQPAADESRLDAAGLFGQFGMRRLRAGAPDAFSASSPTSPTAILNLNGAPVDGPHGTVIPEFCSQPTPQFEASRIGDKTRYWLAGDDVGLASAVDLVMAELRRAGSARYRAPGGPLVAALAALAGDPTKRVTIDVFVHPGVYNNASPELAVYDTVPRGKATFGDPLRERDRLHVPETIRPIGRGLANARLPHIPRYIEMLEYVCHKLNWDPATFRGYRLDVPYPIYGAHYMIGFALPEEPRDR